MTKEIHLGDSVIDTLTGFIGIAYSRHTAMNGNVQWAVQPKGDGKMIPEVMSIDHHTLEVKKKGDRTLKFAVTGITVGDEVEDTVSGCRGTAVSRHDYYNGCTSYTVQPKVDPKRPHEMPDTWAIDWNKLKVTKPVKSATVKKTSTGGPIVRSARYVG